MISEAKALLSERGHDPDRVSVGDGEDAGEYSDGSFDAVVALGVFPHVIDEPAVVGHMSRALRPGGVFIAEFRNALFSAFTLNEYSRPFYSDAFFASVGALDEDSSLRAASDEYYRRAFGLSEASDSAPAADDSGELTYKSLVAKFHNPLDLTEILKPAGLRLDHRVYYHFHAAPPALEASHAAEFRNASLQMESRLAHDWRGMFMASAFVAVAVKE
jgi:SAM-dependent methyltransferase